MLPLLDYVGDDNGNSRERRGAGRAVPAAAAGGTYTVRWTSPAAAAAAASASAAAAWWSVERLQHAARSDAGVRLLGAKHIVLLRNAARAVRSGEGSRAMRRSGRNLPGVPRPGGAGGGDDDSDDDDDDDEGSEDDGSNERVGDDDDDNNEEDDADRDEPGSRDELNLKAAMIMIHNA